MAEKKRTPKWLYKWKRAERKARKNWAAYDVRGHALAELGFSSYAAYLASPLWKEIRARRLAAHPSCACCPAPADQVHHDTYYKKLLEGDEASVARDLYPLCRACHHRVEFDGSRKRSAGEAVRQFRRMLFRYRNGMSKGEMIRQKIDSKRASKGQ